MISVVIPLYNKESQINQTIQSVLRQSFQDFEIVVVDDGSTDNSVSEVKRFNDPRIRIISQTNAGVSAARNRGIAEAKGEFIALLDGDDEWKPDYLATQYALTEKYPECDVFATDYEFRSSDGKVSPTIINCLPFNSEDGILTNYFEVATHSHPPICSISIMVRKGIFESVGGFPLGIRSGEDLLTWARLACRSKIAFSRKVSAIYNLGEGYDFSNLPPRRQDEGDPVGKELLRLYKSSTDINLRRYIGHWHKMRASVAIRYGSRLETLKESVLSLHYYPANKKILPFFILPFIPNPFLKRIISHHK